jgi:hypothetical protein
MSLSSLILGCGAAHGHHALRAACVGACRQRFEAFVSVTHTAQQHGQIGPRHQACVVPIAQLLGDVAGCGSKYIAEQQDLICPERCHGFARQGQAVFGRVVWQYVDRTHAICTVWKNVQSTFAQGRGQRGVGDEEDTDHDGFDYRACTGFFSMKKTQEAIELMP